MKFDPMKEIEKIQENAEKARRCNLHKFEQHKPDGKYTGKWKCINCGCIEPAEFVTGYAQGLGHIGTELSVIRDNSVITLSVTFNGEPWYHVLGEHLMSSSNDMDVAERLQAFLEWNIEARPSVAPLKERKGLKINDKTTGK